MEHTVIKRAMLIIFHIIGIYCSASQRVIERIRHLENRVNSESQFRNEDYDDIIDRLDEIDKRLNASLEQKVGLVNVAQETVEVDLESVRHLREDFTRLRTAFKEEKSETARIRREIPKIENNLISMKQSMGQYCTGNLNKTEQLILRVEKADEFIKSDIAHKINEIIVEQKALRNEITEEEKALRNEITEEQRALRNEITEAQNALRNEINFTSFLVREEFRIVAAEIEKNIRSIVEHSITSNSKTRDEIVEQVKTNTTKTEKIDMLVTNLPDGIGHEYDSCSDVKTSGLLRSGIYKLLQGLEVYCDQTTDGGGWTVFQRRQNGKVDFFRNWREYKNGFGDVNGEFWLGNEHLSILTATGDHELRIDMEDFGGNRAFAKYSKFRIYPEEDKYKLDVSGYSGNASDSLEYHNGMAFTTFDNDNDKGSSENCAISWHGAWWYNRCHHSNLNGQYFNEPGKLDAKGIVWWDWKIQHYCLKSVEMKFR
ncbi:fibrinogen C domain-containing protein 1-B-like [Mercenaria mercenaria]|uniref:fibrinogen C domain-containing protein 1-B-like n=1 Tax=Mercenaria mercenaria TaxID=6596 RepID=UPI00234FABE5|nr:fibrinogen C domain-containing protein 1-B-like [Mercenaria mercenaria]